MAFLTLLGMGESTAIVEAQPKTGEYHLKAAFLFHFVELVEWPSQALAAPNVPVMICTLGGNPFQGDLEAAVEGKLVGARPVIVRHLKQIQEVPGCQVLFVSGDEHTRIPWVLAKLKAAPVLTVGETEEFVKQGGMIGLCLEGNKVRLDINPDAAQRAGLKISSRLLLLAKNIKGNRG